MSEEIKVSVVEFGDRTHYQLQWVDPSTGLKKTKSSGVKRTDLKKDRDKAVAAAGKLEAELREGRYFEPSKTAWEDFKARYTTEVADALADSTGAKVAVTFSLVDRHMAPPPKRVTDLTASRISEWITRLLNEEDPDTHESLRSASTVAGYCRHLKAALNWAKDVNIIREVPKIRPPKTPKGEKVMKGRAITTEEYERMLMKVEAALTPELLSKPKKRKGGPKPKAPDEATVKAWQRFLKGLWLSGLRLSEALTLSWDLSEPVAVVMQPGYRPVFQFRAEGQKSGKAELCPMAPEFAQMLEETPEAERAGRVFKLPVAAISTAGRTITAIGDKAGVIVDEASGKTASAHDFRRAFGTRWAKRVMPAVLRRLMRHASIETTMKYYVDQQADDIAEDVWAAFERSNTFGNSGRKSPSPASGESS